MSVLWALLFLAAPVGAEVTASFLATEFEGKPIWYISTQDRLHFGYLSVQEDEEGNPGEVWYLDGKELAAAPAGAIDSRPEGSAEPRVVVDLSPDGKRLAYVEAAFDEEGRQAGMSVAVNGKAGRIYESVHTPLFSPDGAHLAYAAKREGIWRVVLDGKEGPSLGSVSPFNLEFSRAGNLAYLADREGTRHLFLDHKAVRPWPGSKVTFSPDWRRLAATLHQDGARVEVDDAPVGRGYRSIIAPTFSPSGARFAFFGRDAETGPFRAVIDGTETGPPLDEVKIEDASRIYFPPGSEKAYWFGKRDGAWRLYIDGEAQPGAWDLIQGKTAIAFGPGGKRHAYAAIRGREVFLVVDGKAERAEPFAFYPASGIFFDNEEEFHFLRVVPEESVGLTCAAGGPASAPRLCPQKARKLFPQAKAQ